MLTRVVEVSAVLDQLGTQIPHGSQFVGIDSGRHDQDAANAEKPASVREGLTVVTGRASNDAPLSFLLGQSAHQVNAATDFERSGRIVVFVF
jgi:hypothetical protein